MVEYFNSFPDKYSFNDKGLGALCGKFRLYHITIVFILACHTEVNTPNWFDSGSDVIGLASDRRLQNNTRDF